MQLPREDRCPPLLLALHLHLDFTSEMNKSLIKDAFFKPCFDTQPMAFPSELSYSPAAPDRPSPWPSTTQHLCQHLSLRLFLHLYLLFHQNNPSTMQYNWLESETQCALMHFVLNSLRDCLWFNWLKDTETWSWHIMLRITYLCSSLSSLYSPSLHHLHLHLHLYCLHLCKKKYRIKVIFMYFLFNVDLSKFDSKYYDIRYIHSLVLNSGPWTETGTIKKTLNIKQNEAIKQKALNIIPAPMWLTPPPPCLPPPYLPPPSPQQHI